MRTIAVTGSASGIGAAISAQRAAAGDRVIGVDLRGADVAADLSTAAGREAAVQGVVRACDGKLDGLVAISSSSATISPGCDSPMVEACLAGDSGNEAEARRLAADLDGSRVYAGAKLALARWVRRQAPSASWAGARVRLNAVAPGAVLTPLLQAGLDDPIDGPTIRGFPIPAGGFGSAELLLG